jgi:hypothetical protein
VYILVVTYFGKLIPLYAGFIERTSLGLLMARYTTHRSILFDNLSLVALAPAWLIIGLAVVVSGLAIRLAVATIRSIIREPRTIANGSREDSAPPGCRLSHGS